MSKRVVYGIRAVEELVKARPREVSVVYVAEGKRGPEMEHAVLEAKTRGVAVEIRPRALVADLAGDPGHQGIIAVAGAYKYYELEELLAYAVELGEPPLLVILDGITDPQNLGAIARSAEVMGAHGLIVPDRGVAAIAGGAVKASAGATERMRIAQVPNLLKAMDRLREARVTVWGTAATHDTVPPAFEVDLTGATALVIGSEGRGLREAVARRCDSVLAIPMRGGIASLNASAAAAILLYEVMRQRAAVASGT